MVQEQFDIPELEIEMELEIGIPEEIQFVGDFGIHNIAEKITV